MNPTPEVSPRYAPRLLWGLARLLTAVAIGVAVVGQFTVSLEFAIDNGRHVPTAVGNFFSFFTILSNIVGALVFTIAGVWLIGRGGRVTLEPRGLSLLLLCASTWMIVTGVVYNALLRGIELPQGATFPLGNEILHMFAPAMFLLDVVLRIARRPQPSRWVWAAAGFPLAWVVYTMVRGEMTTNPATGAPWWYPYPFLDPYAQPEGYLSVMAWVILIAAIFIAVAAGIAWWSRVGRSRGHAQRGVRAV